MSEETSKKPSKEVLVRVGDFWAKVSPGNITIGYGGGPLAEFPDLTAFRNLLREVEDAWAFVNKTIPTGSEVTKPEGYIPEEPEEEETE
ncbi:MAG: hypothetical protein ACTSUS_03610 [Candidatus Freyarchaeota archaeon]